MSNRRQMRILIIEDEPMIALGLEEFLIASGFKIAGVAAKLAKALAMIELGALDAAIVDANLGGVSASSAAAALDAKGLPYVLVSRYSAKQQAEAFPGAAMFLLNPFVPERLVKVLSEIVPSR